MAELDNICCITPRGEWDQITIYSPLDLVTHSGSSFIATAESIGTEPTFYSPSWMLLAEKGETAQLNPRGPWQPSVIYEELDVVSYQGSSWIARKESIGRAPAESQFWMLLAERGPSGGGSVTFSSGGGTNLHDDLIDVTPDQHHARNHTDAQHSDGPNSKPGHLHSHDTDLTDISANDHHSQSHDQADHNRAETADIAAVAVAADAGTSVEVPNADHVHPHGTGYAGGHTDSSGAERLFIQPSAPVTAEPVYLWIQTEIGVDNDWTFWFEDAV